MDFRDPTRPRVAALLAPYDLAIAHSAACLDEAAAWLAAPGHDDPALRDLEHLPFVTIDNDDSRDLDQALYIESAPASDGDGHIVWYALADAAYYVRPGSALFAEALRRGASFYLPGLVAPMLPPSLSEGLVSLNEGVLRRALTFRIVLDRHGTVTATEILRARIRSVKKLSYRGVQAFWDGDPSLAGEPFADSLLALRTVGRRRMALAEAADVVRYQRVEVEVEVSSDDDHAFVVLEARRHETDRCNEQISLLVNVEGARLLAASPEEDRASDASDASDAGDTGDSSGGSLLHAVYRVHPAPLPEDLAALARMTAALAARTGEPALAWHREREPLARWLDRLAALPAPLRPIVLALQRQALVTNQRSSFAAEPGRHYGVGAPCYARFSSPMREVVGIYTHKEALELLALEPEAGDEAALRASVIRSANRAKDVQRELTKAANRLVLDAMLDADLTLPEDRRPRRPGTVIGLTHDRAYVLLDAPPLELKVYARDLGRAARLEDADTRLVVTAPDGAARAIGLGDEVHVWTRAHDARRDRYVLDVTPTTARPPAASPA